MTRLPIAVLVLALAATGCSGDGDGGTEGPAPATATPTSVGDRARVEVLDAGAEPRRVLQVGTEGTTGARLSIDQDVTADRRVTDPPAVSIGLDASVAAHDGGLTLSTTYQQVQVDDPGLTEALQPVVGAEDDVALLADGTSSGAAPAANPQLAQVRAQLLTLLPVLPTDEVGVGASWAVTSVLEIDGATVDQVATYRLESLDGDDYVIGVEAAQQYRTGAVEGVEVTAGRGTTTGRLVGVLGQVLPTTATADVSTQVSYDVGTSITEVETHVSLGLTAS